MPLRSRISLRNGRRIALLAETLEGRTLLSATGRGIVAIEVPSALHQPAVEPTGRDSRTPAGHGSELAHSQILGNERLTDRQQCGAQCYGTAVYSRESVRHLPGGPDDRERCRSDQFRSGESRIGADPARRNHHWTDRSRQARRRCTWRAVSKSFRRRSSVSRESPGASPSRSASRWNRRRSQNIHNYVVKFSPNQNFSLGNLYGVGLVQTLDNQTNEDSPATREPITPRPTPSLLVATEQLGSKGSYQISNAPRACWRRRPDRAMPSPLTDVEGNVLDQGGSDGTFSITISKGKALRRGGRRLALIDGN